MSPVQHAGALSASSRQSIDGHQHAVLCDAASEFTEHSTPLAVPKWGAGSLRQSSSHGIDPDS